MKKFAVGVLVFALVAAMAPAAFAEPTFSGYVLQSIEYRFGDLQDDATTPDDESKPYTFGKTTLRVNISGNVGENLSYYGRIQGTGNSNPTVTLAYGDIKNFGVEGLSFRIGRQSISWTSLNSFDGLFSETRDAVSASYSADAVGFNAFYSPSAVATAIDPFDGDLFGARVTYGTDVNGFAIDLGGQLLKELADDGKLGYGVGATVGLSSFGDAYLEWGKNVDETDFLVIGSNIAVLEDATGISAWVEYDVEGEEFAFELSRKLFDGFTAYFGSDDSAETFYLKGEFQVSF